MKAYFAIIALTAVVSAHKLEKKTAHPVDYLDNEGNELSTSLAVQLDDRMNLNGRVDSHDRHACDFVDDNGDDISTSLMPEN